MTDEERTLLWNMAQGRYTHFSAVRRLRARKAKLLAIPGMTPKAQAWLEYQPIRNLPLGRKALHNHFRSGGIVAIDRLLEAFKRTDLRVAVEAAQVSAALAHDEEAIMGRRSTKTGRLSSTQPNLQNVSRTLQNIADADEDEDE